MVMHFGIICKATAASPECNEALNDSVCPEADEGKLAEIRPSQSWILQ